MLLDAFLSQKIKENEGSLRKIVSIGVEIGLSTPGFATALCYFDAFRSQWLPTNLIQAQRDYFGSHTYKRIDKPGTFHTDWEQK